ncbi:HAD family hydrolase [Mycobacteroides abscessus]|uniref:HAD family hydrolase n=1 Tax=Mycobacteroides abscessus TaxID=36809 RepID=UPI000C2628D2|nr:HAD family phosphatase [Mycobacteroides abscessus]
MRLVDDVVTHLATGEVAAVLFDWDGTFADSAEVNYQSMAGAVAQEGIALDREWYMHHSGVSTREMLEMLLGARVSEARITDLVVSRSRIFASQQEGVLSFADAVSSAEQCRLYNVRTAVASGGSRHIIERYLATWGVEGLFDAVVAREDVERGKPDPAIFLLAARVLGVDPIKCVVLEDSVQGLLAAERAGMRGIDVRPLRGH